MLDMTRTRRRRRRTLSKSRGCWHTWWRTTTGRCAPSTTPARPWWSRSASPSLRSSTWSVSTILWATLLCLPTSSPLFWTINLTCTQLWFNAEIQLVFIPLTYLRTIQQSLHNNILSPATLFPNLQITLGSDFKELQHIINNNCRQRLSSVPSSLWVRTNRSLLLCCRMKRTKFLPPMFGLIKSGTMNCSNGIQKILEALKSSKFLVTNCGFLTLSFTTGFFFIFESSFLTQQMSFQCWRLFQRILSQFSHSGLHRKRVLGSTNQVPVHVSSQCYVFSIWWSVLPLQT